MKTLVKTSVIVLSLFASAAFAAQPAAHATKHSAPNAHHQKATQGHSAKNIDTLMAHGKAPNDKAQMGIGTLM